MTYADKLKDPRWQKKRLEVFELNEFTCEDCESKTEQLHIHHTYYQRGLMPWEYPNDSLKCLCEDCHRTRQNLELDVQKELSKLSLCELDMFFSYVFGFLGNRSVEELAYKLKYK